MKEKNSFIENLEQIDPEGFVTEYKIDRKFEDATGIKGKRFKTIMETNGKQATLQEVESLLDYYSNKIGKKLELKDLFGSK